VNSFLKSMTTINRGGFEDGFDRVETIKKMIVILVLCDIKNAKMDGVEF